MVPVQRPYLHIGATDVSDKRYASDMASSKSKKREPISDQQLPERERTRDHES